MPTYMDIHTVDGGLSAVDVAEAHKIDLALQAKHGVDYKRYWVDEEAGKIFCLVDAPSAEAAAAVHLEAHGRTADQIFEVTEGA
jgi:hypothetical protein